MRRHFTNDIIHIFLLPCHHHSLNNIISKEVDKILNAINSGTINTFDDLQKRLNTFQELNKNKINPTGSLARRIRYIELLKEQAQVENINDMQDRLTISI